MPRWHSLVLAPAIIAVAAPAAADDAPNLQPAAQTAILAGARACLGATLDPDPRPARFAGWVRVSTEQEKSLDVEGKALTRENVLVAIEPGKEGGCALMARSDAAFDPAVFYPKLSATVGATVTPGDKPALITLPNGEIFVLMLSKFAATETAPGAPDIVLVFASAAGKFAKKGN